MLFREQCIHSYVFLQASCLKVVLLERKMRTRTEIIITSIINQQLHLHNFNIKYFKNT